MYRTEANNLSNSKAAFETFARKYENSIWRDDIVYLRSAFNSIAETDYVLADQIIELELRETDENDENVGAENDLQNLNPNFNNSLQLEEKTSNVN